MVSVGYGHVLTVSRLLHHFLVYIFSLDSFFSSLIDPSWTASDKGVRQGSLQALGARFPRELLIHFEFCYLRVYLDGTASIFASENRERLDSRITTSSTVFVDHSLHEHGLVGSQTG